jgi:uracil-DNA glycosylase family 4
MFVGEAPGFHEDQQGIPFVGQAGKLLDKLLAGIGLTRADVYVANTLKCLRYRTQVQLGDGSWERIDRLVRSRYSGEVVSVDEAGNLVPRRVVGWHATPLAGRRVFRLTYSSAKNAGLARVSVELTGDHPVLTERGYIAVEDLEAGDRIATGQGMSALACDVASGTLLGDGSVPAKSACLVFGHSVRQRDYALFKAELLRELLPSVQELEVAAAAGGARAYGAVHVRTRAHRALGLLGSEFYGPNKRVPGRLADGLNERMLAIWFMDDGYTRIRGGRRKPLAEIATVSFDEADLQILLRGLFRLGLSAKALRGQIYFDVAATRALCERIAPYIPPSMRYKLDPEVASSIPFDPERFDPGQAPVLFDEVEVEDITERPRTDTTFFCIDVEETHNFVTAGGVVHNCRPPGNRDPLPEEKHQCEPWLFRQIELIKPKVIATLGNHATKQLTGKETGITRVHGQPQQAVFGSTTATIFPIYHPAAALSTPAMLKVLEEDFAKIPALLEQEIDPLPSLSDLMPEPEPEPVTVQLGLF